MSNEGHIITRAKVIILQKRRQPRLKRCHPRRRKGRENSPASAVPWNSTKNYISMAICQKTRDGPARMLSKGGEQKATIPKGDVLFRGSGECRGARTNVKAASARRPRKSSLTGGENRNQRISPALRGRHKLRSPRRKSPRESWQLPRKQ